MTVPGTQFAGPVLSGPRQSQTPQGTLGSNVGYAVLSQVGQLQQNGTAAVSYTFYLPPHSQLVDVLADTNTAWNSATSALMSLGTTAGDTTYVNGLNIATAARVRPSYAGAALLAMQDTGANEPLVATITPTGATSAGSTFVTILYRQTLNWQ